MYDTKNDKTLQNKGSSKKNYAMLPCSNCHRYMYYRNEWAHKYCRVHACMGQSAPVLPCMLRGSD